MKKILSYLAFVAIMFGFAACGNEPEVKDFLVQMNTLTAGDASFTITPLDEDADYYWTVYPKCYMGKNQATEQYLDILLALWATPEIPYQYDRSIHKQHGTVSVSEGDVLNVISKDKSALCPNSDYVIALCKIDENKKRVGSITVYPFRTLIPEGFVDMGFPSGNLWCCDYVLDNGTPKYYSFSEAEQELYEFRPNTWIPSLSAWQELRDGCTWAWSNDLSLITGNASDEDIRAYVATSKTNGKRLCFPIVGSIEEGKSTPSGGGFLGVYWTAKETANNKAFVVLLKSPIYEKLYEEYEVGQQSKTPLCFIYPSAEDYYY